jgi:hypothetical protein
MRQKISTLVDPAIYRRVKLESVRRNKQISEILGEALEKYLASDRPGLARVGVVAATWGAVPLPKEQVQQILRGEEGLLEA